METTPEKNVIHCQIEGTFGDRKIKLETLLVLGSKKLLLNVHGAYGSLHGGGKYSRFAQSLQENGSCNVALTESSRNAQESTDSYEQRMKSFDGKNFEDDVEDVRRSIKYYLDNSKELFNVSSSELEITMNGNSLGGIIALILANEFSQIKKISTVGTGLRLIEKESPLAKNLPPPAEIVRKINSYQGQFLVQYGSEDSVFELSSFQELYEALPSAEKRLFTFAGVDHTFSLLKGKKSSQPYDQVYRNVRILVDEDKVVGGSIALKHENELKTSQDEYSAESERIEKEIEDLGLKDKFNKTGPYDESSIINN